ncbi:O-antigen ligase family protein [Vibrio pomeroyi]|uniref:O-antigen ligase family protein n=1 Tax=Vibrio pomeroyi TaxID=198832 RepID=UPI0021C4C826|nr:hypothetical protein [Vibrio pomeroyi]
MLLKTNKIYKCLFSFFIVVTIFYPTFIFGTTVSQSQKILFLIQFLFISFVLFLSKIHLNNIKDVKSVFWPFLILFLISSVNFVIFLSKDVFNYLNSFRYFFYPMCFMFGFIFSIKVKCQELYLHALLSFILFSQVLFVFGQYVYPESYFVTIFSERHLYDFLGKRVGGSFDWTYILGYFLITCLGYYVSCFYSDLKKRTSIVCSLVCIVGVLATQSRTALISLVFLLFFSSLIHSKSIREILKFLFYVILISIVSLFFSVYFLDLTYVTSTLSTDSINEGVSGLRLTHRSEQISNIIDMSFMQILVGSPDSYEFTIENAYGHYLFRHGIFGLIIYVFAILASIFKFYRSYNDNRDPIVGMILFMLLALPLFSMTSSPVDAHKFGAIFWCLFGLGYGRLRNVKR